jgi:hypothetical protein
LDYTGPVPVRRSRLACAGAAGALALAATASAQASSPVAKRCPLNATVAATLKLKVLSVKESYVKFSNGPGVEGSRRTCTYQTAKGTPVTVMLTAGSQVLGFVDAQEAASESNTGYQNTHTHARKVIPVFGRGNDGWAFSDGGTLSALYKSDAIVINVPHASVKQLKALAQATLGIPSPNGI